jgi:hypothetical protein
MILLQYLITISRGIMVYLHGQCSFHELLAFFTVVNYAYHVILITDYWLLFAAVTHAYHLALLTTLWLPVLLFRLF